MLDSAKRTGEPERRRSMVLEHWQRTQAKDSGPAIGRVPGSGMVLRSRCWLNPNPFLDLSPTLAAGHSGMVLVFGLGGGDPAFCLLSPAGWLAVVSDREGWLVAQAGRPAILRDPAGKS